MSEQIKHRINNEAAGYNLLGAAIVLRSGLLAVCIDHMTLLSRRVHATQGTSPWQYARSSLH